MCVCVWLCVDAQARKESVLRSPPLPPPPPFQLFGECECDRSTVVHWAHCDVVHSDIMLHSAKADERCMAK